MKRVSLYCRQPNSVDEQAKTRSKHQALLEDYLELQKDFVSNKKKLLKKKQERETLLAEVRFLRQRHKYLTMLQSRKSESDQDNVQLRYRYIKNKVLTKDENYAANGAPVEKQSSPPALNSTAVDKEGDGRNTSSPLRVEKRQKGSLSSLMIDKRVEKKKISWQDPVA